MPHPGFVVAQGRLTDGNVQQIDREFIDCVKELVPSLFAPENLIVKKINEQKVRARDLITYMQAYVGVFNSDTLPEPKSVLMVRLTFGSFHVNITILFTFLMFLSLGNGGDQ